MDDFAVAIIKTTMTTSYTHKAHTGDRIVISLKTAGGYKLSPNMPFTISRFSKGQSYGVFIDVELCDVYVNMVENNAKAEIIDRGDRGTFSYVLWNYNDYEFDCVINIKGTKTGILIGNDISEESAKECLKRLTIKVEE